MSRIDRVSFVGRIIVTARDVAVLLRLDLHTRSRRRPSPPVLLLPIVRIVAIAHTATEGDDRVRDIAHVLRERQRGGTVVGRFADGGGGGVATLDTPVVDTELGIQSQRLRLRGT
jgi:hypothetical protein